MQTILMGVFLLLHSLVHLLYAGQSLRLFELRPNMIWPDDAWLLSKIIHKGITRVLASISLVLGAFGFIAGGVGLLLRQGWWQPVVVGAAVWGSTGSASSSARPACAWCCPTGRCSTMRRTATTTSRAMAELPPGPDWRNPVHVLDAAKIGADIATVPYNVLMALVKHPLTDIGIDRFLKDWQNVPKK